MKTKRKSRSNNHIHLSREKTKIIMNLNVIYGGNIAKRNMRKGRREVIKGKIDTHKDKKERAEGAINIYLKREQTKPIINPIIMLYVEGIP